MAALDQFPPTRESGLERLKAFVPNAARDYETRRNFDLASHDNVSTLSPYLRHRLLTEEEVLRAVLDEHSRDAAQAFVGEVFWRTYFKGWLEMRPTVWGAYWSELVLAWDQVQSQTGLRDRWEAACRGETGIDCFDHWAHELVETGYLHNHARMWFASIWMFTLGLPWALGADFFLRHLCDGDPASNTLSWRWVGGLHTPGKVYKARASNIEKFTDGRFNPKGQLAGDPQPIPGAPNPERMAAPEGDRFDPEKKSVLLLHSEDLSPEWMFDLGVSPMATGVLDPVGRLSILHPADHVRAFKTDAMEDCLRRHEDRTGPVQRDLAGLDDVMAWARDKGAEQIVTSYPPVGPSADMLKGRGDVPIVRLLRDYDRRAWPNATAGYFKFKDKIPKLLGAMNGIG